MHSPFDFSGAELHIGDKVVPVSDVVFDMRGPQERPVEVFRFPNVSFGFTSALTSESADAIRAMAAGFPVDPRVDEEWDAWRCPGCGRSHAKVGTGHWWRQDFNTGTAECGSNTESA